MRMPLLDLLRGDQHLHYRDTEGRPLGEQKATTVYSHTPTVHKVCPYQGSRHQHEKPMNVSALKQMSTNWGVISGVLALLNQQYRTREGVKELDYFDLWRITSIGALYPSFLILRARDALADGQIPVFIAGVYKVLIGISGVVAKQALISSLRKRHLLSRLVLRAAPYTPQALLAHVEESGAFIGQREVCAGPPKLVEQALRALMLGEADCEQSRAALQEIEADDERLYQFGLGAANLALAHTCFIIKSRRAGMGRGASALALRWRFSPSPLRRAFAAEIAETRARQFGETVNFCRELDSAGDGLVRALFHEICSRVAPLQPSLVEAEFGSEDLALAEDLCRTLVSPGPAAAALDTWLAESASPRRLPRFRSDCCAFLVQELIRRMQTEQRFLRYLSQTCGALAATLERPEFAKPVTHEMLVALSGPTLTSPLANLLPGLAVDQGPDGSRLRYGSWERYVAW